MKTIAYFLSYLLIRVLLLPFSLLSQKHLHKVGEKIGIFCFPFLTKYRKRALSNLALATDLSLTPEEIEFFAKKSLGNLFITALEYGKFSNLKRINSIATCINPEQADLFIKEGKGVIFFCSHQANWEVFFLEGSSRMAGIAIGQPIKNPFLYGWILRMRQQFGGTIIEPKQAVKEGLRALKKGHFLGIVGDQGMPEAGFCSPFLGRLAWTSPLPALLAYRSKAPIIVATMTRQLGKYFIHYSPPIFADPLKKAEEEIPRLMKESIHFLEESIRKKPEEWLWQHNKWKQQGPGKIKRPYRQDTIAIVLPQSSCDLEPLLPHLDTFRKDLYPSEFLTFFIPEGICLPPELHAEVKTYKSYEEIKTKDYRFKLLFNFTADQSISDYFMKLAVFHTLSLQELAKLAGPLKEPSLSNQLKKVLLYAS